MSTPGTVPGPFHVGKTCTLVTVIPETVTVGTGVLTDGTPVSLLGKFDSWRFEATVSNEDIHSTESSVANHVPIISDFTLTISELLKNDGSSVLMDNFVAKSYISFTGQSTGGSAGKLLTATGMISSVAYALAEGKNMAVMTVLACGILPTWA